MIHRPVWLVPVGLAVSMVAVLFQLAITTGHWNVAGCQSPPHEKKLLDRYEVNRAITVGPPGATGRDPVRRQACVRRGRDITDASVTRRWSGKRPYGETELRSLYDRAGQGPVIETGPGGRLVLLRYCAVVGTVVSYLQVKHFRDVDGSWHEVFVTPN